MLARQLAGAGGIAARPLPTFVSSEHQRETSSTTNTVAAPVNIQNGDLLVAFLFNSTNGVTVTPPSGFNVQYLDGTVTNTAAIATKVASSESGDYTFTWSASTASDISILVYRNATAVNTIGTIARGTTSTASAASITPTYRGVLCAAYAIEAQQGVSSAPSGMTLRLSATAGNPAVVVYDQSPQEATATSAKSLTWQGAGATVAIEFQVTNEPDVEPEFVASASTQNTAIGASLVIAKPTGTVEGDLMIAVMAANVTATWTGDTGWSERGDQATQPSLRIATKTAGASEPSSYTFTISNSNTTATGCILTYRYAAYDTIAGAFTTATNPLVLSSVSPSLSQSVLIAAGARIATSITLGTPTSMTARFTDNNATSPSYIVCDQVVAKGPTGTRAISTNSTINVAGIMVAIKPTRSL